MRITLKNDFYRFINHKVRYLLKKDCKNNWKIIKKETACWGCGHIDILSGNVAGADNYEDYFEFEEHMVCKYCHNTGWIKDDCILI